jgi:hypothetical protein
MVVDTFAVLAVLSVFIALANLSVVTASSAIPLVLISVNAINQLPPLCLSLPIRDRLGSLCYLGRMG